MSRMIRKLRRYLSANCHDLRRRGSRIVIGTRLDIGTSLLDVVVVNKDKSHEILYQILLCFKVVIRFHCSGG
ncbi:hypothetical protein OUZ56_008152 [Daphnia magna]|uniref:Uncharacterized protein n=1 Tax=Daphnia magna TaxID=35525 RepID=A0ABR0AC43_9CRUS|nr:hypothetical protein OUZ56_008152 [Daphnia magna]